MKFQTAVTKAILSLLALLPISSLGIAAESRLTDMENEAARTSNLDNMPSQMGILSPTVYRTTADLDPGDRMALRSILPPYKTSGSTDDAFSRFSQLHPELSGDDLSNQFQSTVDLLAAKGIISHDKNAIIGGPTSRS